MAKGAGQFNITKQAINAKSRKLTGTWHSGVVRGSQLKTLTGMLSGLAIGEAILKRKKTKMSWRQKIRNWFNKDLNENELCKIDSVRESTSLEGSGTNATFRIHSAQNGLVLEVRKYDEQRDRNNQTLYIIPHDSDYNTEIASIIGLEMLKF